MSTHGRMSVRAHTDRKPRHKEEIILYAWHDGHTKDAIKMLLEMPITLHEYARDMSRNWRLHKKHTHGPWYYDLHMSFALGRHSDNRWDREDLVDSFARGVPIEVHAAGIANWISFIHFDRWTVVPNLKWCAYPGDYPDIIVDVDDSGYYVSVPLEDKHPENIKYYKEGFNHAATVNKGILDKDSRIRLIHKIGDLSPQAYVPIFDMTVDLMWQDIQKAYEVLDGKAEPDPYVTKMYEEQEPFRRKGFK